MRWIVRIAGVVLSLLALAVGALFLLPAERIAALAAGKFQQATGRALTIAGPVRPTIWPHLGARVEGVTIATIAGATGGPLLTAEVLDIGVDPAGLIAGDIRVRRFEARGAQLVLERDAQGRANWVFDGLGGTDPSEPGAGRAFSLDQVQIRDASIRIIDRRTDLDLRIDGLNADLSLPDFAGPGDLSLSGRQGGQAFSAQLRIGAVQGLLEGRVVPLSLRATLGPARLGFEGRAGLAPPAAEGRATMATPGLAPLLALAGQAGPEPLPAAASPLDFAGQVTLAPAGSLHLRDATLAAGAVRLQLGLDIATDGPRPRVTGRIDAGALDLRPLLAGPDAGTPSAPSAPGWPTTRIEAGPLGLIDAEIALTAGPVQTGTLDIDRLNATLTIDRARAVLTLREAALAGGGVTGELVANNRSGLSVGGNIRAAGLDLLPLLRQAAGFERLTGTGDLALRFLGSGPSVDAIMRSLRGEGNLTLGRGEIIGLDLAGMIRNLDMAYMGEGNRTLYDSVTGTFTIQGGVLTNTDLRMATPLIRIEGAGRVDLGNRTLDYRVTPVAGRNAQTEGEVRIPLIISGPWAAPRFRLDLEGLAEQRLREEAARIEAQAREELARREAELRARAEAELQQRLGVQLRDGQSPREALEQSLRQRAVNEADAALRRLLGVGQAAPAGD